ncbi:hypothetical protein IG631_16619 [Alternaria alternata]|nr:hypothetical protein IG631_16619 [Alternaria alternata]
MRAVARIRDGNELGKQGRTRRNTKVVTSKSSGITETTRKRKTKIQDRDGRGESQRLMRLRSGCLGSARGSKR